MWIRDSLFSSAAAAMLENVRVTPASDPLVVAKGRMCPGTNASMIAAAFPPAVACALG